MKFKPLLLGVVTLLPLVGVNAVEQDSIFDLTIEQLMKIKVESATLTPIALGSVPASIYIMERSEFSQYGIHDLSDLLALMPGVEISNAHSWLQGGLRGFADNWSQVKLLVDGEELNLLYTGEGFIGHQFSLHDIERVEVVPSPASVIYGADAYTGLVNLVTRKDKTHQLTFNGLDGPRNLHGSKLSYYGAFDATEYISVTMSAFALDKNDANFDDWVTTSNFSESSLALRQQLLASGDNPYRDKNQALGFKSYINYEPSEDTNLQLKAYYIKDKDGGGQESAELSFKNFESIRNQTRLSIHAMQRTHNRDNIELKLGYKKDDEYNQLNFRGPVDGGLSPLYRFDILNSESWTLESTYNWLGLNDVWRLSIGLGYKYLDLTKPDFELDDFTELEDILQTESVYGFTELTVSLSPSDVLKLGTRLDTNELYDSPVVSRIAYLKDLNKQLSMKWIISESFRAPTMFELESNEKLEDGQFEDLAIALKPSLLRTMEWSTSWDWASTTSQISLFRTVASDLIVNKQIPNTDNISVFRATNEGDLAVSGVELTWKYLSKNMTVSSFISYTERDDNRNISPIKSSINMANRWRNNFTSGINLSYRKSVKTDFENENGDIESLKTPDFIKADLTTSYDYSKQLKLQAKINNVFDRDNELPNVRGLNPKAFLQLGRHYMLNLQYKFD